MKTLRNRTEELQRISPLRRRVVGLLVPVFLAIILGVPLAVAALPALTATGPLARDLLLLCAPPLFLVTYILVAGGLSRLCLHGMVAGNFPRDLGHPIYGPRRLHALCWTSIYYFPLLYHAVLAVPALRWLTFRLFGYRGSLRITVYPDTWLRDLPLLDIGPGVYLSNKATIGTNMCLMDGTILVSPICIEARALIGHAALIGPGCFIGERAEIGVGTAVGVNARVGAHSRVSIFCILNHGAVLGERTNIGTGCLIGVRARLRAGVMVPAGTVVPPGKVLSLEPGGAPTET